MVLACMLQAGARSGQAGARAARAKTCPPCLSDMLLYAGAFTYASNVANTIS